LVAQICKIFLFNGRKIKIHWIKSNCYQEYYWK